MSKKLSKRKRAKNAFKSEGQKVGSFAKSRVLKRFLPLFGLVAIFKPSAIYAFTLDNSLLKFA